ncbi:hypothetical protein V1290_005781 [Bradyrhizobium sp. AZCC 1578]|uniref:hypothetical protein n=1 Tax=Bradyrhizobium sp. AZCC 1578 TaxID=3117027 RepID=UPI002FF39D6D
MEILPLAQGAREIYGMDGKVLPNVGKIFRCGAPSEKEDASLINRFHAGMVIAFP